MRISAYKAIKGALLAAAAGIYGILTVLGVTVGYGMRSFYGYLQTKQKYQLNLTESLYYQNLDNNAGVLTRLLDEAEEQENREAALAYFFLWRQPRRAAAARPPNSIARSSSFLLELLGPPSRFRSRRRLGQTAATGTRPSKSPVADTSSCRWPTRWKPSTTPGTTTFPTTKPLRNFAPFETKAGRLNMLEVSWPP